MLLRKLKARFRYKGSKKTTQRIKVAERQENFPKDFHITIRKKKKSYKNVKRKRRYEENFEKYLFQI